MEYKYLGTIIDELLSFHNHLKNTIKILVHNIYLLQKIRYYINENAATKIYKSMILPYADYGDIFFTKANSQQLKKLQTLQNRALRIIFLCLDTMIHTPVVMLHQSAQLPLLAVRREVHLINVMYKMRTNTKFINNRHIRTRLHDAPVFESS